MPCFKQIERLHPCVEVGGPHAECPGLLVAGDWVHICDCLCHATHPATVPSNIRDTLLIVSALLGAIQGSETCLRTGSELEALLRDIRVLTGVGRIGVRANPQDQGRLGRE